MSKMVRIMTEERTEYARSSRRENEWKSQRRNEKRSTFCGVRGVWEKRAP